MMLYDRIILGCWIVFVLMWLISALFVKRDVPDIGGVAAWQRLLLLRITASAIILMLVARIAHSGTSIGVVFFPGIFVLPPALGWAGAALTAIGIGFAVWTRAYLGRNWSPRPTVKEQHELITSGPYAFVRHPIYSGIALAMFGMAITGALLGIVMFISFSISFALRIGKEEQLMIERFPNQYLAYQRHTKRLVPFVW